jgi:hypothetical protein
MKKQTEVRGWMAGIIESVFSRFPVPRYMGAFLCRPEGANYYLLHVVSAQPFTEADGRVFADMEGFFTFNPSRVVFKLEFEESK